MTDQEAPGTPRSLPLPWWWWLIMFGLAAIGFVLWRGSLTFPVWITRASGLIPAGRWHLLVAIYIFGLVGSHVVIHFFLGGLTRLFGLGQDPARRTYYPVAFVGFAEAILYPTALLVGQPEFIGVWLALKVAGQWKEWKAGYEGRAPRFNRFLIGSAL